MEYLFPSPYFQSVCVPRSEIGLSQTAYGVVLFFCICSASLCLLVGAFNPFIFEVIINIYILNCHLFTVLFQIFFVGLFSFLPLLFSCELMTNFSVVFGFLFVCVSVNILDLWYAVTMKFWYMCHAQCFSRIQLFVIPWTVVHLTPLSMGFSRQKYWSGLPFPSPGDLSNPGTEPKSLVSPAL